MMNAQSAENLSYLATIQELAAITFTITYNFAKSFPIVEMFDSHTPHSRDQAKEALSTAQESCLTTTNVTNSLQEL